MGDLLEEEVLDQGGLGEVRRLVRGGPGQLQADDPRQIESHIVEHDRRDDLTDLIPGFEDAHHPAPDRPDDDGGHDGQEPVHHRNLWPEEGDGLGEGEAHDVLPLPSDVEEADTVGEAHGEAAEDERHRVVQCLADVADIHPSVVDVVSTESLQQRLVHVQGILPHQGDEDGADEESHQDDEDRDGAIALYPSFFCCCHCAPSTLEPAIIKPI